MTNEALRREAKEAGIYLWQVAEELGISSPTLSIWLRHELSPERMEEAMAAIRKIERRMNQ